MDVDYKAIVEAAGAQYRGVIFGRVSFDNSFGSTISLAPEEVTVDAVRRAIAVSDRAYRAENLHPILRKFTKPSS